MIDTDKYEGHTEGPWDVYGPHPLFRSGAFDGEGVGEHLPFTRVDMKLIADAPLLLEEVKRLMHCLRYVGARLYLDANDYRPYDYAKLLEFCMDNTGEPDDMSGKMGAMIEELSHLDEKLEVDKEMIE